MNKRGFGKNFHVVRDKTSYGQGSENRSRKFGRQTSAVACSDHKVYIVWLESFDDCYTFPAREYFNLMFKVSHWLNVQLCTN
ncbi:hypothetical protein E2C01_090340 [Portunus trituberculatus]|uniref:Uncharacterized protein n=1 Tax=Portunus trituberculatus TaxID=210409 RepID=A0A5B7JRZ2_PORTR|nr:hypothetical protein [Portunus trituberculatus]